MSIKINYGGLPITKPGYYANPWWDVIWRKLKRDRNFSDDKVTAFLDLTDTLIRLNLYPEHLWKGRNVK